MQSSRGKIGKPMPTGISFEIGKPTISNSPNKIARMPLPMTLQPKRQMKHSTSVGKPG